MNQLGPEQLKRLNALNKGGEGTETIEEEAPQLEGDEEAPKTEA